jgi:hypothetical protein
MKMIEFMDAPDGFTPLTYSQNGLRFTYPEGSGFAEFDHGDRQRVLRVVFQTDTGKRLRINITFLPGKRSAYKMAAALFVCADTFWDASYNIPPFRLQLESLEGWRCRKRLVDGSRPTLVIDTVFLETDSGLFRLEFAAYPTYYDPFRWVFDLILRTFSYNINP